MTSELRPAVETRAKVLDQLLSELQDGNAWDSTISLLADYADLVQDLLKDREAVRAEQAAEIERLTLTVRKLQGHQAALESYLREIRDKPVARSSDAWKRHCLKLQAIAAEALGDVA